MDVQTNGSRFPGRKLFSNIVLIGLVSLFMDMSTEMVYPLVPLFLTATLGASPAIVGVIEGIAESLASLLKVFSGYVGDVRQNKKRLAFVGYAASAVYKVALLLSSSWAGVLVARIIDRTGKGIRTAPRDALVAQSCDNGRLGGGFGMHKMLDMAGSALGVVLAFVFVATGMGFHGAFLWSIVPAVISIAIIPLIREEKCAVQTAQRLSFRHMKLDGRLKLYLAAMFLFCLGNSSNTFLLLKASERGFSTQEVILLYLAFNVATSALAIPAGRLSDKLGRSAILVPGYVIYGLVYLGFALLAGRAAIIGLFIAYGAYSAFVSGAERAFVAEAAPKEFRGTVLGFYGMLQGIGLLLSSIIAGLLWDKVDSNAPFLFGGVVGLVSAGLILIILRTKRDGGEGMLNTLRRD